MSKVIAWKQLGGISLLSLLEKYEGLNKIYENLTGESEDFSLLNDFGERIYFPYTANAAFSLLPMVSAYNELKKFAEVLELSSEF